MNLMKKYKLARFPVFLLSVMLLVSGCSNTHKTDFYQLDEPANSFLTGVEKGAIVGVGPINLPEYLNRPQIITRDSAHHLNVSEFHRWVEPLNDSITRMLVINLANNLRSNRVYWIPRQERQYPLDIRVVIDIGRFEGQLGKMVIMESRWSIFNKQDQPVLTRVSLIKEPVKGQDYENLVIAMNKALQALGMEIAQAADSVLNSK